MGPVRGIDVRDKLLDENVLAHPVFLLRVVVPAHGTTVREDVDRWLNLPTRHGLIDKSGQRDTLLFQSRSAAMEVVDDWKFPVLGFWRIVLFGQINVVSDLYSHARALERCVPETGGEILEGPLLRWIVPGENRVRLEVFRILGLSEASDRDRDEESEQAGMEEFHSPRGR